MEEHAVCRVAGTGLLLLFYGVYMVVHVIAIIFAKRWLYSRKVTTADLDGKLPGVSVIKPIIGCDPCLRSNLEGFFNLDYPKYELLLAISEASDPPSLPIVMELVSQYPHVETKILQGGASIGVNPKINNMAPAYKAAKFDLIWINDSSLTVPPYTLAELVSHIYLSPQVGLVHQLPYVATVTGSFADRLEQVYFGTQHSRVYLVANWLQQACANGMSWLIRKEALEQEGGLTAFSEYLAEDFFIGKAIWKRGWKIVLSTLPALQHSSTRTLSAFQTRVIRWGRLRATMMPIPGLIEPVTECLGLGLLGALCSWYLLGTNLVLFLLVHTVVWFCCDMILLRIVQNGPVGPLWQILLAWVLREVWTLPLFLAGIWSREVAWKGRRFHIKLGGKATKLE